MKVKVPQIKLRQGNIEANVERIKKAVEERKEKGVTSLFVFPELTLIGYYAKDMIYNLHMRPAEVYELLADVLDENTFVGVGFIELAERPSGVLYNSYAILGPQGVLGVWRKRHLPVFTVFEEGRYFASYWGSQPVVEIDGIKVGVAISYDVFFPEAVRELTLKGAELVLVPSASPIQSRELWGSILGARAIENGIFVIFSNNVGWRDGLLFFGESRVVNPLGKPVAKAKVAEEDYIEYEIDTESLVRFRTMRPTLRDFEPLDALRVCELIKRNITGTEEGGKDPQRL